jgi:hypothetical protein
LLIALLLIARIAPPDLTAESGIIVDDPDSEATLRRGSRGREARGPSTNYEDFEMMRFPAHLICLFFGVDFHALLAQDLTASNMRISVDDNATLKANSHTT